MTTAVDQGLSTNHCFHPKKTTNRKTKGHQSPTQPTAASERPQMNLQHARNLLAWPYNKRLSAPARATYTGANSKGTSRKAPNPPNYGQQASVSNNDTQTEPAHLYYPSNSVPRQPEKKANFASKLPFITSTKKTYTFLPFLNSETLRAKKKHYQSTYYRRPRAST